MLKSVFIPNKSNSFALLNLFGILLLIAIGEIAAYTVLFGYFLETIIIGVFNIFKMYACRAENKLRAVVVFSCFFVIHYGGFVAIQSIFLFAMFSFSDGGFITEPFNLVENYGVVLQLDGMFLMLSILTISQLLKYYFDFVKAEKHLNFNMMEVMFKPYLRIFIQQFVVLIGSFFILFSEASIVAALLLVILRFVVDFFMAAIKEDSYVLDCLVNQLYNGTVEKAKIRKQLILFSE